MGKLTPDQIDYLGPSFETQPRPDVVPQNLPGADQSTVGLAFELENPVYNLLDWLDRPVFQFDPNFTTERWKEKSKEIDWFDEYSDEFVGVQSEAHFDYIADRLRTDIAKRQQLASRGWSGVVAAVGAGLASPTILLPLVGSARGAAAFASGAGYGLLAAGADEVVLQANRPGRTNQETAIAIGASTVVGGLLGGLVRNLSSERLPSVIADVKGEPTEGYVMSQVPVGSSPAPAGAQVTLKDPGGLRAGLGAEQLARWSGPVGRGLGQKIDDVSGSVVHRNFVAQVGDGGLRLEGVQRGISATEGEGTIENRITTYSVHEWNLDNALHDAYVKYRGGGSSFAVGPRSEIARLFGDDRLTFKEFSREFTRAMFNDGVSPNGIKEVEGVAIHFRQNDLNKIYEEAVKKNIFKGIKTGVDPKTNEAITVDFPEEVVGDPSYWMRQWDANAVANKVDAQGRTFVQKLTEDTQKKLLARFNRIVDKLADADESKRLGRDEASRQVEELGATNFNLDSRTADFSDMARQLAEEAQAKIMSSGPRMAQFNAVVGKRGSELARTLQVRSLDYEDFIEMDPQVGVRRYIRTLAPDIELAERFGDPGVSKYIDDLEQERAAKAQTIEGKFKSDKQKQKALDKLNKQYEQFARDAEAMVERLKHTRGLPNNPNSYLERAGRVAMGVNTLRFMGSVVPSSIADVGRIIFKHGFGNTFKYALAPAIRNFKAFQMSAREAKYAGTALDALNHRRALALVDMFEDFGRRSKFEKGVDYLASRMGMYALFDYWTSGMKMIDSAIVNGRVMDAIARIEKGKATPGSVSAKTIAKDNEFLASIGLDGGMAERIWRQMDGLENGGGQTESGVWLPNTESWTDARVQRAYRTALANSADTTIITPGIERPLMTDASTVARMVFQFKSFVFSSQTRTVIAGLQQRDANAVMGVLTALFMGGMSYAAYKTSRGEWKEMQEEPYEKWMDEAIDRSGLLGVFSLGQQLLQRVPATSPYMSFSGQRTERRASQDLIDFALGPSLNLAKTVSNILVGLDEPTQSTANQMKLLVPFQNVFYMRYLLEQLTEAGSNAAGLPERRR